MESIITTHELVEGCKKGDRKAQEKLYSLYASKMMGLCLRYARDNFEAEDMLQTGFIRMFEKIHSFRNEGSFEGWLRRLMVNNAIELYRQNLRMFAIIDPVNDGSSVPEISPSHNLHTEDLLKFIQELSPGYRMVFNMYAIEGYNHREIAETLGINEGTSKSQLARARTLLQEKINKQEVSNHEKFKR